VVLDDVPLLAAEVLAGDLDGGAELGVEVGYAGTRIRGMWGVRRPRWTSWGWGKTGKLIIGLRVIKTVVALSAASRRLCDKDWGFAGRNEGLPGRGRRGIVHLPNGRRILMGPRTKPVIHYEAAFEGLFAEEGAAVHCGG